MEHDGPHTAWHFPVPLKIIPECMGVRGDSFLALWKERLQPATLHTFVI